MPEMPLWLGLVSVSLLLLCSVGACFTGAENATRLTASALVDGLNHQLLHLLILPLFPLLDLIEHSTQLI
jgi:hypothetical protein